MTTDTIIEIFLALVSWFGGMNLWQVQKRDKFLKTSLRDESFLSNLISRDKLENVPPDIAVYADRIANGYAHNIHLAILADKGAGHKIRISAGFVVAAAILGSYLLGAAYLAINAAIFFLSAVPRLSQPGRYNAMLHILTIAVILDRWRTEKGVECEEWMQQTSHLRPLYNAVKTAR